MKEFSALKLLDKAILPVVILLAVKLLSVFLFSLILDYPWSFSFYPTSSRILMFVFNDNNQIWVLSNISDFLLVLTAALFLAWKLFKVENLSNESIHPSLLLQLYEKGREFFISPSEELYHEVSVWLSLTWFSVFVVCLDTFSGLTSPIILGLGLAVAFSLSALLWKQLTLLKD